MIISLALAFVRPATKLCPKLSTAMPAPSEKRHIKKTFAETLASPEFAANLLGFYPIKHAARLFLLPFCTKMIDRRIYRQCLFDDLQPAGLLQHFFIHRVIHSLGPFAFADYAAS